MAAGTLAELNRRNDEFWKEQNALMHQRLADEFICKTAYRIIACELVSRIPVRFQRSYIRALAEAETEKQLLNAQFRTETSRKGGKAKKADNLQKLIEGFVERDPALTKRQLDDKLMEHQHIEPIQDICDGIIHFTNRNGGTKQAKISGLKDRLSRAKKTKPTSR